MDEKIKGAMKRKTAADIVKWLETDKGQEAMQKGMEDAKRQITAIRSSMRVDRECLLTPVTL